MRLMIAVIGCLAAALTAAARPVRSQDQTASLTQRFLARSVRTPGTYRAKRRLEAANLRFKKSAWIEATTELNGTEFTYAITARGGSEFIQKRALIPVLEAERELQQDESAFEVTHANYRFGDVAGADNGSLRLRLLPLRKDKRLVDGWLTLTPEADVIEITGRLAKAPSFWTRSVTITRRYDHIGGVRVPVSTTSIADVRLAGRSTFSMTYEFEVIDGVTLPK